VAVSLGMHINSLLERLTGRRLMKRPRKASRDRRYYRGPEVFGAIAELRRRHLEGVGDSAVIDLRLAELKVFSQNGEDGVLDALIRSDHGTQYTSWAFTRRALDSGLVPSMGSIGDCYDNGQMESFWARMQVELLNRKRWNTRLELANAIFEYLETFHNRQRRHSSLGMLSPIEYERRHAETAARDQAS